MSDASRRLEEILREEAASAGDGEHERLLRHLADTTADMTPAERSWVQDASEDELRGFARAISMGCARQARQET